MKLVTPGVDQKRARFYDEQSQFYSLLSIYFRLDAEQQAELLQYINKLAATSCRLD